MSETPAGAHSCGVNPRLKDAQAERGLPGGKYGRMFPGLPSCEVDVESAVGLGRAASRMDATLPVVDEALENPRIPAGFAILGQFVAHDITADRSLLARARRRAEDLTQLARPEARPRVPLRRWARGKPVSLRQGRPGQAAPRRGCGRRAAAICPATSQGVALVGDPRNDVHLLISQLHVAFLRFHNRAGRPAARDRDAGRGGLRRGAAAGEVALRVDRGPRVPAADGGGGAYSADVEASGQRVLRARREPDHTGRVLRRRVPVRARPDHADLPPERRLGEATIFPDCLGGRPVEPELVIDWSWFFDLPGSATRAAAEPPARRQPDARPHRPAGADRRPHRGPRAPLAGRPRPPARRRPRPALRRGGRPDHGRRAPHARRSAASAPDWTAETPLWYYVFKEAEVRAGGRAPRAGRRPDRRRGPARAARRGPRLLQEGRARAGGPSCPSSGRDTSPWPTWSPSPAGRERGIAVSDPTGRAGGPGRRRPAGGSRFVRPQTPRNLTAEQRAEERTSTPLELFFDLCFVVAVAALARGLHDEPNLGGVLASWASSCRCGGRG